MKSYDGVSEARQREIQLVSRITAFPPITIRLLPIPRFSTNHHKSRIQTSLLLHLHDVMDSFLTRLNTPSSRLILVAIASSTLTALTIYSFQSLRREHALSSVKAEASSIEPTQIRRLNSIGAEDIKASKDTQIARQAKRGEYDEELVMEQLARNRSFFGEEGIQRIRKGFVIVVGAGGVGSWAATMLARSGIGIPSLYP